MSTPPFLISEYRFLEFVTAFRHDSKLYRVAPDVYLFLKEIAWNLGGEVTKCDRREYGPADITINKFGNGSVDALLEGLGDKMKASYSPLILFRRL
jgi:hypothetical protein